MPGPKAWRYPRLIPFSCVCFFVWSLHRSTFSPSSSFVLLNALKHGTNDPSTYSATQMSTLECTILPLDGISESRSSSPCQHASRTCSATDQIAANCYQGDSSRISSSRYQNQARHIRRTSTMTENQWTRLSTSFKR